MIGGSTGREQGDDDPRPGEDDPLASRNAGDDGMAERLAPGGGTPSTPDRYQCPMGDGVWYRLSIDDPVPVCPAHNLRYVAD